jgi:stage IV sporulation protein B
LLIIATYIVITKVNFVQIDVTGKKVIPCGTLFGIKSKDEIITDNKEIATITFYDVNTKKFSAVGHEIPDAEEIYDGNLYSVTLNEIEKSSNRYVGWLKGKISDKIIGKFDLSLNYGIIGDYYLDAIENRNSVEIASRDEVKTGKATIICTIDSSTKEYQIEILSLNYFSKTIKNMKILITDPTLLEATGGIVRGMSGSPILQNGKLIGAINYVLEWDPRYGYAIFADTFVKKR